MHQGRATAYMRFSTTTSEWECSLLHRKLGDAKLFAALFGVP